jgi:hypothetical protein
MIERMLTVGADPLFTNNAGYAAHSIAFNQGHQLAGEIIADAACISALNNGDYTSALALIREGASVNVYNPQGDKDIEYCFFLFRTFLAKYLKAMPYVLLPALLSFRI